MTVPEAAVHEDGPPPRAIGGVGRAGEIAIHLPERMPEPRQQAPDQLLGGRVLLSHPGHAGGRHGVDEKAVTTDRLRRGA
jgi:hypothetical protein